MHYRFETALASWIRKVMILEQKSEDSGAGKWGFSLQLKPRRRGFGPENDQLGHTRPSSRSKRNSRSSHPLYGVHKSLWHRCGGSGGCDGGSIHGCLGPNKTPLSPHWDWTEILLGQKWVQNETKWGKMRQNEAKGGKIVHYTCPSSAIS